MCLLDYLRKSESVAGSCWQKRWALAHERYSHLFPQNIYIFKTFIISSRLSFAFCIHLSTVRVLAVSSSTSVSIPVLVVVVLSTAASPSCITLIASPSSLTITLINESRSGSSKEDGSVRRCDSNVPYVSDMGIEVSLIGV